MIKKSINPWTWQDNFGFVQANEIKDSKRMLYTAGIVSVDENGDLLHADEMEKQIDQILANLETIFDQAEMPMSNIVRLTYYTTDVSEFTSKVQTLIARLKKWDCKPATTLLGVDSLFHPNCVVEIEAIAAD